MTLKSSSILERKPIAVVREWEIPQKDIYLLRARGEQGNEWVAR